MQRRPFGRLGDVSAMALGGGGIGQVWGQTTRVEAVATVREAVDAGISLIDVAPAYGRGEAELVLGEAFEGRVPAGVRISTKVALFMPWSPVRATLEASQRAPREIVSAIDSSLAESLQRLRLDHVDVLFLHDLIQPDGADPARLGIWHSLFGEVVRPAFERLVAHGRIGAWGLTALGVSAWQAAATGVEDAVIQTFGEDPPPAAAQVEVNALYPPAASPGTEPAGPAEEIAAAGLRSVGVMGIRPTRGGALTDAFDRDVDPNGPEMAHYRRAAALRALAAELGMTPATLAHRYALAVPGVACVTLGVKNRTELRECLAAETRGPLDAEAFARVVALARSTA